MEAMFKEIRMEIITEGSTKQSKHYRCLTKQKLVHRKAY